MTSVVASAELANAVMVRFFNFIVSNFLSGDVECYLVSLPMTTVATRRVTRPFIDDRVSSHCPLPP